MKLPLEDTLLHGQVMALGGLMVFQCLGRRELSSLLFTLTFFLTAGIWLVMAVKRIHRLGLLSMVLVLAVLSSITINALLTGTPVSPSYYKKGIMFSATVLLFGSLAGYVPRGRLVRFVFRMGTALSLFFAGMYLLRRPQMYLLHGRESGYLTFGFTSPNLTAVFLCGLCMLEAIQLAAAPRKRQKGLHWLLMLLLGYFVMLTRARNAQLLLGSFFLAMLVFRKRTAMPKLLAATLTVFPIAFVAGYLLMIDGQWVGRFFSFLSGEGKGLDSRVMIWRFALEAFLRSPLAGAYSQISGGTGTSQMHNSHMDVLASYGVVVFILFCLYLYGLLAKPMEHPGRVCLLCRLAFGALLLSGLGEAMLFSGGMGIYLLPGILLMLGNFNFDAYENFVF